MDKLTTIIDTRKKCPTIIICICFALSVLIVPLILGVYLYIRNKQIDDNNKEYINKTKKDLEESIENLNTKKSTCQEEYNKIKESKDELYNKIKTEAKDSAKLEMEEKLKQSSDKLEQINNEIETKELLIKEKQAEYEKSIKTIESNAKKVDKLKEVYKSFKYAIKEYEYGNAEIDEKLLAMANTELSPVIEMKLNCMNVKQLKSKYTQLQKDIQQSFNRYEGRYTTKANVAIYKLMVIALEAELQNVLYALKYGKLEKSLEDIKEITTRYLAIAVDGNQSIAPTMKKFIGEIEYLFIEAVKVEYEYYTQKERIKEEQRALKEQMRQEAEERKQLESQRKQIEKEESKYKSEIEALSVQVDTTEDDDKTKKLLERIAELKKQLESVEDKKEEIVKLQNGKAGYVYIISNLGSFGENVFKVGMTRRLEPMDRVKELGDASVPFSFDVHSFIFSNDAVSLENTLHKELNDKRVNKVNLRKEFFRVSMDEIENLVYKHEPSAEFNRTMLAEQYNQSLSMNEIPNVILDSNIDNEEAE